ncbi:hypothetical protein [Rhizobium laguerreae]|uniref:hypothetical protein n=1 Tax=Rhizobium laguerreae TaxID=1076926 RepID=UPI001C90799C|nr:hypothetical protein [Rhizobium laguerreae]MBY3495627.1 hypothetical protein [Rhizobium laguerreae]MBY3543547.1 hypothetical protein [Rhizobium laguerreae]
MPTVQQKNLKDNVTVPTCSRNSHKGISARKRSEKNPPAASGLIPIDIPRISNVQDNIPDIIFDTPARESDTSSL